MSISAWSRCRPALAAISIILSLPAVAFAALPPSYLNCVVALGSMEPSADPSQPPALKSG